MVQILPGLGEQLGPALGILTESVLDVMNPNRKLQEAMQTALATNPALLQQLATIEKSAPGTSAALGLGPELASVIAATPETTEAQIDRATGGQKVKTATKKAALEDKQVDIQSTVSDASIRMLATNMGIGDDAARRMMGLPTTQQEAAGEQGLRAGEIEIDLAEERLKEAARIEKLRENIPALQDRGSMRQIARDFMNGKLNPLETTSLFSTPEMAQGFTTMLSVIRNEEEDALRKEIAATQVSRTSDNREELTMAQRVQRAFTMFRDSNNAGTLESWENAIFEPDKIELVRAMVADPNKKGEPSEQPYREIADYYIRQGRAAELENTYKIARITQSITTQEAGFSTASSQERLNRIESINLLLKERAQLGGPTITASMPDRTLARDNVIEYRDSDGRKLTNKEVASIVRAPTIQGNTGGSVSQADQPFLDVIMGAGNKQITFDKLMLEDSVVAKRLEPVLRARGVIK